MTDNQRALFKLRNSRAYQFYKVMKQRVYDHKKQMGEFKRNEQPDTAYMDDILTGKDSN